MKDAQVSRPVVIALVAAVLLGAYLLFFKGSGEEVVPPPTAPIPTAATGSTGASRSGATSATGETGATGETLSKKEQEQKKREEKRRKRMEAAREKGIPFPIYDAMKDGKIVILFFHTPGNSASQKVNTAVNQVSNEWGSSRMKVVRDDIKNISRYGGIARAAEITQTPGLVILYKNEADTWMGYIDDDALDSRVERLAGPRK
jgi:hypothetical protein